MFSKFSVLRNLSKPSYLRRTVANCPEPSKRPPPKVLTIIGGNTGEAQLATLLLKRWNVLEEIRLYSGVMDPCSVAMDLADINTGTQIRSYYGHERLKDAVTGAQIVLICGGHPNTPDKTAKEMFETNADYVRNIALHVAEFSPDSFLCISTPPITAMVPMVAEVMKKASGCDPRKLFGIAKVDVSKSNSLFGQYLGKNPADLFVPVVGGTTRHTTVSVFSQVKPFTHVERPLATLMQDKVTSSEDMILDLKQIENTGSCFVINAYGCARFIKSLIMATRGQPNISECAYVRQNDRALPPYMTSVIGLGPEGVTKRHTPKLDDAERESLKKARCHIEQHIQMGWCYVNGEKPMEHPSQIRLSGTCEVMSKRPIGIVGDVVLDPEVVSEEVGKGIEIIK